MNINPLHIGISRWAAQNIVAARFLFFCSEILRISIAFFLGKSLIPSLAIQEYLVVCIALLGLSYVLIKRKTKRTDFKRFYQKGFLIMSCSWLLYFCTGSFFSNQEPTRTNFSVLANDVQGTPKSGLLAETIKKNKVDIKIKKKDKKKMPFSTKRKILYGLLFLLSLPLTAYGLAFACSLGCSGYVFWPWVFYILSFGALAAGISFLIKLFSKKKPRKYRNLSKQEKWKTWKTFLLTWLLTLGGISLLLLILSITS